MMYEDYDCDLQDIAYVGEPAPEFTAEAYYKGDFTKVSLADYKGKWTLLFFYPLDFTFICPTEILELSERVSEFEEMNTQVVSASVDSVHSHKAWCKEIGDLNFPMIADMKKELSMAYRVLNEDGISMRGAFIIDPDGVLQSMVVNNLSVGRSIDELKRTIEAFQTGELCPVNWNKGKDTLGKA